MSDNLAEQMKETVTDMLGYYGFSVEVDYKMPVFSDYIDIAVLKEEERYPEVVIFCSPGQERAKFISRIAKHSSIGEVVVIDPEFYASDKIKLPAGVRIYDLPDIDHTKFEEFIRSISPKKPLIPYFSTVSRNPNPPESNHDALLDFEKLVRDQGLDVQRAKYEIYRTAISGMNIRYGRYIQVDDGKPVFERSRDLSREAILLKAAGYFREEKIADRGLGLDSDGNSFLVLSEDEVTASVAEAVVDQYVRSQTTSIKKIMSSYPRMFSYVAIIGSLGYYAPKTLLSIERHRKSWTGVIRSTAQSENSYLVEVIRTMMNTVGISEEVWNRINCLSAFGEVNGLIGEYFEKFEKAKIGVFGYRGLRRIYIPAKRIATQMRLSDLNDELDQDALEEFCIYDSILRSNHTGFDFRSAVRDMNLDREKLAKSVEKLAKLGFCSKILPENSDLPIAIYNQPKFSNHCLKIMREKASSIMDIEW